MLTVADYRAVKKQLMEDVSDRNDSPDNSFSGIPLGKAFGG
jgi:hypothetical protein